MPAVAGDAAATALPPLRWAADTEGGAPYVAKDPEHPDRYVGFEVELAAALEHELGRRIELLPYNFTSLGSGLLRGDFDFAMNGLEDTPDRREAFRLTRPYYVYTLQLVARKDETRFASLAECKQPGLVVATLGNTAASRLLEQEGIAARVYSDQVTPYKDLEQRQVDAVLLDLPIAVQYTLREPEFQKKLKFVGRPLAPGFYVIALGKDQPQLAAELDAAILRLLESGRLRRIYQGWGLWNDDQQALRSGKLPGAVRRAARWTFSRYFPVLLRGAMMTVALTVTSMLAAILLGLPIALCRLYGPWPLRLAATVYVEFFRGIPVLLLLFFLYYSIPEIGGLCGLPFSLKLNPFAVGVLGFGLNYAAYEAEIYRGGIASIAVGQWEAGASLGMSTPHVFRRIILPQAVRVILPPMTNDFVALFKDTSVVSVIAVSELMKQYQTMANDQLQYVEMGLVTIVLYLVMSLPLAQLSRRLERRWGKGR
ncbi:MAG: ABC transporter substrate-binding protein/permease [Thermoguttaceae bacterium]